MKTSDKRALSVRAGTVLLLLFACFYMYDFYKCLSGFIANGFREPLVMLPMILAFFLPVFCFLFRFYDVYVGAPHSVVRKAYSVFVIAYAVADLVLIFRNIGLYASNNALGVYDALLSFGPHFPYDMIVVLVGLAALQVFYLVADGRPAGAMLDGLKQRGTVCVRAWEYLILSVLAVVVFVFAGAAICGAFSAFSNTFYDFRYLFLLLWVLICPMGNLALLTLKPERMRLSKRVKLAVLGAGIGVDLLFGLLFWILERTCPDFLVHVGKPLFLIAFSVSLPIEPVIIFGIMAVGAVVMAVRLAATVREGRDVSHTEN